MHAVKYCLLQYDSQKTIRFCTEDFVSQTNAALLPDPAAQYFRPQYFHLSDPLTSDESPVPKSWIRP